MTDRRIIVLENGRHFARGLSMVDGRFQLFMDGDDVLNVTVDWADWLDADTISTSTFSSDGGAAVAGPSNTTTTATVTLSGEDGISEITNKIVTAAGLTKVIKFLTRNNERPTSDYPIR